MRMFFLRSIKNILFARLAVLLLVFILSSCASDLERIPPRLAPGDSVFDELTRKWIASAYFDEGMNYQGSRLEVVSFSQLLDKYIESDEVDAILLNCADDYQGIVSVEDVRRYDLQLATKIELAQKADRPDWLQPLMIVVPDEMSPPFLERFLTANINELRFVRLTDYYAPLDRVKTSFGLGLRVFKDNCLFCHSINDVGGNKGGILLDKFDFRLDMEKFRFEDAFLRMHGQDNANKQNTKQFLTTGHLIALLEFLSSMAELRRVDFAR